MRIRRQQSSTRFLPRKSTRPQARSLPGTTTRHGKTLAGPPGETLAKRHQRGHNQARTNQVSTADSHAAASPTSWAGTCVATCSSQANSAHTCVVACRSSWRLHHRATSAACLPTWHRMHRWPGHVLEQGGAATDGTGLVTAPIKQGDTSGAHLICLVP